MEKGVEKLLRKLVMKKYPQYLDVRVVPYKGVMRYSKLKTPPCEVYLVIHEKDYKEDGDEEIGNYIRDIAKYMNVDVMRVYDEIVNDEEWEGMKSDKK